MGFLDRLLNRPAPTAAGPNVASVGVSPRYLGGRETLEVVGEASYQEAHLSQHDAALYGPGPWPGPVANAPREGEDGHLLSMEAGSANGWRGTPETADSVAEVTACHCAQASRLTPG